MSKPELVATIIFNDNEASIVHCTRIVVNAKNLDVEMENENPNINSSHITSLRKISNITIVTTGSMKLDISKPGGHQCDNNGRILGEIPPQHTELDAELLMYDKNDPKNLLAIVSGLAHEKETLELYRINSVELTVKETEIG